jgi:hypothetical protein
VEEEELNDPDPFTTKPTRNKDFWQHYSPTAWIDMYNESVRNVERITELYKESVRSTERMMRYWQDLFQNPWWPPTKEGEVQQEQEQEQKKEKEE